MKKHLLVPTLLVWLFSLPAAFADITFSPTTQVVFADQAKGRQILGSQDQFVKGLSPFDRASRLKTDQAVDTKTYLNYVKKQVIEWSDADKQTLREVFGVAAKKLAPYKLKWPGKIVMIKTTGKEEGYAAYTRANAIMFGDKQMKMPRERLQYLIYHELFHVLSRNDSDLKRKLYGVIGFTGAKPLSFPQSLKARKITNPDAPINDHFITVELDGRQLKAVPILFSKTDRYDVEKGGEFFAYLDFKLLEIRHNTTTGALTPVLADGKPNLFGVGKAKGFMAQIGQNTGYIIHPEEVLADNFSFLMTGKTGLKSPEITANIQQILEQ